MNGSSFGSLFRVSTFGESHGKALGVVIDGCPSGLELDLEEIGVDLARRRPGQSKLVTPRKELDEFEILSGMSPSTVIEIIEAEAVQVLAKLLQE